MVYFSPAVISATSASVMWTGGSFTQLLSESDLYLMAYSDINESNGADHWTITEFVVIFNNDMFLGGLGTVQNKQIKYINKVKIWKHLQTGWKYSCGSLFNP